MRFIVRGQRRMYVPDARYFLVLFIGTSPVNINPSYTVVVTDVARPIINILFNPLAWLLRLQISHWSILHPELLRFEEPIFRKRWARRFAIE